jgi:hypothetical protein
LGRSSKRNFLRFPVAVKKDMGSAPSGIRTAKRDVDLVADRLKAAQKDHEEHYGNPKR